MSGVSTPCSLNDDEDLSLARLSIRRNTQSFHDAGDPRDWERAPASLGTRRNLARRPGTNS
jgi:hypothetical protein